MGGEGGAFNVCSYFFSVFFTEIPFSQETWDFSQKFCQNLQNSLK